MPKYYLTTAIDYSNGDPHLGHALEKVGADAIARYRRLRGDDVRFLMGMDEHSQAVIQAAEREGYTPQAWVDRMAERFETFWRRLECSNDDWIRTTEPRHREAVTELLERKPLSQATYDRLLNQFGVEHTIEIVSIAGLYSMVSTVLNTFDVPTLSGENPF